MSEQVVHKGYKLRLYPTAEDETELKKVLDASRFIYNYYLNLQINCYQQTGEILSFAFLSRDLTLLRHSEEYKWLEEVSINSLQQSLRRLDSSYCRYIKKLSERPRFKSSKDVQKSFTKVRDWSIKGNRIAINKNALVKFRGTLPMSGDILNTLVVSVKPSGKWYASFHCLEDVTKSPNKSKPVGIDLGLTHLAITSDGDKYDNLRIARQRAKRLKLLSQSLARKRKGSRRREKAKLEVSRLHEKIANQRMNHLHQVSSAITRKNHALIAVEDLAVSNMLKNHKLAKSISDVSWSELLRQLEYKQSWRGGQFCKIDRYFPSSKTCSNCLYVTDKMPLNVREWTCPQCGALHDRDINAAKNILKQAEVQLGVETTPMSVKRGLSEMPTIRRAEHCSVIEQYQHKPKENGHE